MNTLLERASYVRDRLETIRSAANDYMSDD
jgi:hypothetical protein